MTDQSQLIFMDSKIKSKLIKENVVSDWKMHILIEDIYTPLAGNEVLNSFILCFGSELN